VSQGIVFLGRGCDESRNHFVRQRRCVSDGMVAIDPTHHGTEHRLVTNRQAIAHEISEPTIDGRGQAARQFFGWTLRHLENIVFFDRGFFRLHQPQQQGVVAQASPLGRIDRLGREDGIDQDVALATGDDGDRQRSRQLIELVARNFVYEGPFREARAVSTTLNDLVEFFGEGLATLFAQFVEAAVGLLGEVQLPAGGHVNVEGDILRQPLEVEPFFARIKFVVGLLGADELDDRTACRAIGHDEGRLLGGREIEKG
jgi:hypothetical protein